MSITISKGWQPGLIGAVTALHSQFYAEHWDFGAYFEAKVARDMANFFDRYDPETDLTLVASAEADADSGGEIVGSITMIEPVEKLWWPVASATTFVESGIGAVSEIIHGLSVLAP